MSGGSGKWSCAFSLRERLSYWNKIGFPALEPQEVALSKKRIQTWYVQEPFEDNQYFDAFLNQNGWTKETFFKALGCNPSRIASESVKLHKWWQTIEECYAQESELSSTNSTIKTDDQFAGLINLVSPLIKAAESRLTSHVEALAVAYPKVPLQVSEIVALWKADLPDQLMFMLSKTLILELNVARLRNLLQGSTPQERFTAFVLQLCDHSFSLAILQEYPVLARKLHGAVQQWERFGYTFFNHLYTDFEALVDKLLAGRLPGSIQEIKQGTGDRHNDGKSVVQIHFSSGAKLVYKPRSLTIDYHFQQLLNRLNEEYDWTPFKPVNILDRGEYGWMEFVPTKECKDLAEVHQFYRRQGALLALLYALESTDFHFENLIANGEFPVLIDLESLFQPRLADVERQDGVQIANRTAVFSVLRVGLLPQRIFSRDNTIGVEVSGIGAEPGQMTPNRIPQWDNVATDKMHLIRERVPMPSANNRPMLNGKDVNTINFVADIIAGFEETYQKLITLRDKLLKEDGLLAIFSHDTVRVIFRPTMVYGRIIQEGYHPNLMRDAFDYDLHLSRLWVGVKSQPHLKGIINAELNDIQQGDVPIFLGQPGSLDIFDSQGNLLEGYLSTTMLDAVRKRINQLSVTDMKRQVWFIKASMSTLEIGKTIVSLPVSKATLKPSAEPVKRHTLIEAAIEVGERLEFLALNDADSVAWLGLTLIDPAQNVWSLMPAGPHLYEGVSGIGLFLSYLAQITDDKRFSVLSRQAINALFQQIEGAGHLIETIGGYTGWGGIIYSLLCFSHLRSDPSLQEMAVRLAFEQLKPRITDDSVHDIISGSAGAIVVLLHLYQITGNSKILDIAECCGNHLLNSATITPIGIGWKTIDTMPLTGFSHGAAGIAWALALLAKKTGDDKFAQAAAKGLAFERSVFSDQRQDWPDLRIAQSPYSDGQNNFVSLWCHGAPGIGIGRLQMLKLWEDNTLQQEISIAVDRTRDQGFGVNHCLCHGSLGNLDFLLTASRKLNNATLHKEVYQIAGGIVNDIKHNGWKSGVPLNVETPGLMVGLAGIGYQLLRLAKPNIVPSILSLEMPD